MRNKKALTEMNNASERKLVKYCVLLLPLFKSTAFCTKTGCSYSSTKKRIRQTLRGTFNFEVQHN